jgi:hypothetical protein
MKFSLSYKLLFALLMPLLALASSSKTTTNVERSPEQVADIIFSPERGFYDKSFMLTLTTATESASIHYTTDGSEPQRTVGGSTFLYNAPIAITTTTCVRARAFLAGAESSPVFTHTYIFLDDVLVQPANPQGFPTSWGHTGLGDYEMDPDVVDDPLYRDTIKQDMKSVPTLSLVMDVDDWFGDNGRGIYLEGELDERPVSAELIMPDGSEGFQINCAVMIVGGTSTDRWKSDKLSMRLKFKTEYGAANLNYLLFGKDATDKFDTIVLDARLNAAWSYGGGTGVQGRPLTQRDIAQYTRDPFIADIQNALGGYAPHGRHVHLYLNGLYWGLYWVHERPDEHFAAAYLGGHEEDYDVLKHNSETVVNGSTTNYHRLFALADAGLTTDSQYQRIQQELDIPNFVDYILTNFYFGNWDWAHQNWYASRNRISPDGRWRYHSWDAEHVMESLTEDVTGKDDSGGPTHLHQRLRRNAQYRRLFADHVYRHFFNDGILTPERIKELYNKRLQEVDRAVVGESARWGDNRRDVPYTRDVEWVTERDWLLNTYLSQRRDIVLDQLRIQGLYPSVDAPVFLINGSQQSSGRISKGDNLSMSAAAGQIYYTMDESDPTQADGGIAPGAFEYVNPVVLRETTFIKARVYRGNIWSALHEATYVVPENLSPLKITEINYHPLDEDSTDDREFEFIELKNIVDDPLNLSLAAFCRGIEYTFPVGIYLNGKEFIVLASNQEKFYERYHFAPFADYKGNLDNAGERIILADALGDTLISLRYNDKEPWPTSCDGDGYSLVSRQANPKGDPDDPGYWIASSAVNGSPGADDLVSAVRETGEKSPANFALLQNYPNPFNPTTTVDFQLPQTSHVTLKIYNILGQHVITLVDKILSQGSYQIKWEAGKQPAGLYSYHFIASIDGKTAFTRVGKMMLLK